MNVNTISNGSVGYPAYAKQTRTQRPEETGEQAPSQPADRAPVLTSDEKQFFEKLFPGAENDVRSHQAYTLNGKSPAPVLGTNVDRKG